MCLSGTDVLSAWHATLGPFLLAAVSTLYRLCFSVSTFDFTRPFEFPVASFSACAAGNGCLKPNKPGSPCFTLECTIIEVSSASMSVVTLVLPSALAPSSICFKTCARTGLARVFSDFPSGVVAVEDGHLDIHEDEVEGRACFACCCESIDCLLSIAVCFTLESKLLDKVDGDLLVDRVVLCNTDSKLVARDVGEADE
ncbi:hypothetical protein KCU81_g18, partial [Aureobasidium melanogenum]